MGNSVQYASTEGDRRRFKSHPESAPGDFYVINGECISCGAPHAVAPDLIGWATTSGNAHCIWKKQPENEHELAQAIDAFAASCVGCYRYAGNDPAVMERIGLEYCAARASEEPNCRAAIGERITDFQLALTASARARFMSRAADIVRSIRSVFQKKG
jgi:hypothetical protein